jgi:hypothetical protein
MALTLRIKFGSKASLLISRVYRKFTAWGTSSRRTQTQHATNNDAFFICGAQLLVRAWISRVSRRCEI